MLFHLRPFLWLYWISDIRKPNPEAHFLLDLWEADLMNLRSLIHEISSSDRFYWFLMQKRKFSVIHWIPDNCSSDRFLVSLSLKTYNFLNEAWRFYFNQIYLPSTKFSLKNNIKNINISKSVNSCNKSQVNNQSSINQANNQSG